MYRLTIEMHFQYSCLDKSLPVSLERFIDGDNVIELNIQI